MKVDWIDTRHATDNHPHYSRGNALPLTGVPNGMNYFAPQTDNAKGSWWFHPEDYSYEGIRLTHQASPWVGDFSYLTFLATTGEIKEQNLWQTRTTYDKNKSVYSPYYLEIQSQRYLAKTRFAPSMYGGKFRISYQEKDAGLLLFLGERFTLEQIDTFTVAGSVINYAASEDPDFTFHFTLSSSVGIEKLEKTHLSFGDVKEVELTLATSFINKDQLMLNLAREQKLNFEETKQEAKQKWQELFDKVEITHSNQEEIRTFAHNYYRAFLFPMRFYELNENNEPIHYQTHTKEIKSGVYYTNNGFWDTAKTVYSFYSLVAQEKLEEMLAGFLNVYREVGYLPKWLAPDERGMMPGTLIDSVIADSLTKGIRFDLAEEFLEAMIHSATTQSEDSRYGRKSVETYNRLGYVTLEIRENINQTLDNAYSDWSIAQVARLLGKEELAVEYEEKSTGYRQLIDKVTGLLIAKDKKGKQREDFLATRWGIDYTEGSAWQNSFNAYHDMENYIEVVGGKKRFAELLIQLSNQLPTFEIGDYGFEIHEMSEMAGLNFGQLALSNQPSFHIPYLFNLVDRPENTQLLVRQLMKNAFSSGQKGYPGDEDNGSMACWYLFSALGFYPMTPGSKEYQMGIALFDEIQVTLSNGQKLKITTHPNEKQHQFVHMLKVNNQNYQGTKISHELLLKGVQMDYQLGVLPKN
ncbi:MAG: GH92 family glycosyl hydrolase [Streptococcaceae bacterium]|jgi:predicted alpha-1,2-mannosidase|nr:GH92 family glycosyl hydrolase [Streptococcaceae bacterium]